jgi:molecular chaperone Hsp33
MLEERPLRFACSCSRERVAEMFQGLGEAEALAAASEGAAEVHCEFCGARYAFSDRELLALFHGSPRATGPTHRTIQ